MQVEDVTLNAQDGPPQTFRRMVFASTPNLIQTEAYLEPEASLKPVQSFPTGTPAGHRQSNANGHVVLSAKIDQPDPVPGNGLPVSSPGSAAGKPKSKKSSKQKKKSPQKLQAGAAAAAAAAAAEMQQQNGSGVSEVEGKMVVDSSHLACSYHHQILASVALLGMHLTLPFDANEPLSLQVYLHSLASILVLPCHGASLFCLTFGIEYL